MTLIVEDGTGVFGANSYISLSDARSYASSRGLVLPVVDVDCEVGLINALDFIEANRALFKGTKKSASQPLQFPRLGVVIDGNEVADTSIPNELKHAQVVLAANKEAGIDLFPIIEGHDIKSESIGKGAVTTEYFPGTYSAPRISQVTWLLKPLFKSQGNKVIR